MKGSPMTREEIHLTAGAHRVLLLAAEEAGRLHSPRVGPEHLLLGLIRDTEGSVGRVLASINLTLDRARTVIESTAGRHIHAVAGNFPLSAAAEEAISSADSVARQFRMPEVDTAHLLLGVLRDASVRQLLKDLGYTKGEITSEINGVARKDASDAALRNTVQRSASAIEGGPLPVGGDLRFWGSKEEINRLTALATAQGHSVDDLVWRAVRRYAEGGYTNTSLPYTEHARWEPVAAEARISGAELRIWGTLADIDWLMDFAGGLPLDTLIWRAIRAIWFADNGEHKESSA